MPSCTFRSPRISYVYCTDNFLDQEKKDILELTEYCCKKAQEEKLSSFKQSTKSAKQSPAKDFDRGHSNTASTDHTSRQHTGQRAASAMDAERK